MSSEHNTWLEDRADWCAVLGRTTEEIESDRNGEYVEVNNEKFYLPVNLQKEYVHDEKID